MKKKLLFLSIILLSLTFGANEVKASPDFSVVNANGKNIYYKVTSRTAPFTVAVTYLGNSDYEVNNEYTGNVIIPSSVTYNDTTYAVTSIGASAFAYCYQLSSVTIPPSVTTISGHAFENCFEMGSITIPSTVISLGEEVYRDCSALVHVNIPNSIGYIPLGTFYNCYNLTSVSIGDSITVIDQSAFFGCPLTSIVLPRALTSIGEWAFSSANFSSVTCRATTPPTLYNEYVIRLADNAVLNVCGSVAAYQATTWGIIFSNIQLSTNCGIIGLDDVNVDDCRLTLYPNPANEITTLEVDGFREVSNVIIYDFYGRVVRSMVLASGQKELKINCSNLPKGIYNIKLFNNNYSSSKKLIVK